MKSPNIEERRAKKQKKLTEDSNKINQEIIALEKKCNDKSQARIEKLRTKLQTKETTISRDQGTKRRREVTSDDPSTYTLDQFRSVAPIMFRRLFQVPKPDHARDCVTTDGVSASWHLTRAKRVTMNNTKRVSKCKAIRTQTSPLVNGQFGNHCVEK